MFSNWKHSGRHLFQLAKDNSDSSSVLCFTALSMDPFQQGNISLPSVSLVHFCLGRNFTCSVYALSDSFKFVNLLKVFLAIVNGAG